MPTTTARLRAIHILGRQPAERVEEAGLAFADADELRRLYLALADAVAELVAARDVIQAAREYRRYREGDATYGGIALDEALKRYDAVLRGGDLGG